MTLKHRITVTKVFCFLQTEELVGGSSVWNKNIDEKLNSHFPAYFRSLKKKSHNLLQKL